MVQPSQHGSDSAAEFVTRDIPCLKCGYNLRSLSIEGRCPECGVSVHRTLLFHRLFRGPALGARVRTCAGVLFDFSLITAFAALYHWVPFPFSLSPYDTEIIDAFVIGLASLAMIGSFFANFVAIYLFRRSLIRFQRRLGWSTRVALVSCAFTGALGLIEPVFGGVAILTFFVALQPAWTAHLGRHIAYQFGDRHAVLAARFVILIGLIYAAAYVFPFYLALFTTDEPIGNENPRFLGMEVPFPTSPLSGALGLLALGVHAANAVLMWKLKGLTDPNRRIASPTDHDG